MESRKNAWPEIAYILSDSTVGELMLALTVGKGKTAEARWNDRNCSDNAEQDRARTNNEDLDT